MIVNSPLDSATWWTSASNVLYITGAIFTALTAAWIVYETRAVALGKHQKFFLLSEILGAAAAIICVLGSIGAIHFGNLVSHLKDVDLATYKASTEVQIAQAQLDAANANKATEDERMERIKFEGQLQWRYLQGDDRKKFINTLKSVPGRKVTVWILFDGSETQGYGEDILFALQDAGWAATPENALKIKMLPPGVTLQYGDDLQSAASLKNAHTAVHISPIEIFGEGDPLLTKTKGAQLFIGPKLPPRPTTDAGKKK